ncbi:alpha/beta hydrolase [Actinospica durhamensis]|uniref:Alpha/beta hydrolase n=1 Tax=Actinospica durhamensis TaxID=1508375 RepID=A0A941EKQ7_9ACTN|nr:alpha/beta hydrolase [Actinospica durhamensis]MBR7833387.1 alpha/beta hydrolase [Actinospica durhamensis]
MAAVVFPAVPLRPLRRAAEAGQAFALAELLRWTWRPTVDVLGGRVDVRLLRLALEAGTRLVPGAPLQPSLTRRPELITGVDGNDGLSAEWTIPRQPVEGAAVLYLHGGAFAFGSARTHRTLTGALAAESDLRVLAPSYRLAPEHPSPAALEDAQAAFRFLEATGIPADRIVVAGDSAGAYLATLLVAQRCEAGLPAPAGVVLFSPWLELGCAALSDADHRCRDPFVSPNAAKRLGRLYADAAAGPLAELCPGRSDGSPPDSTAARVAPYLIQVGGLESLAPGAREFSRKLTSAGFDCTLETWPGQIHVFQAMHPWLPAARRAMRRAGQFARERALVAEGRD